jgi:hypothetical protein
VVYNVTELLIDFLYLPDPGTKWEKNEAVPQLFIDFKKV